ncbi:MAG: Dabb family protein [Clostridia bacterium]|nr:Dabb family protein [Clostridia bacterium]
MIKHVIIWKLKDGYSEEKKKELKDAIKSKLEALVETIDGIIDIKVYIDGLPSSNADIMLDSTFESIDALQNYATHPEHVKIAKNDVVPYVQNRSCLDFEL